MEFGIFDHLDRNDNVTLGAFYEDRLKLTEAYDRHGFFCYHVAEHHATPLGMAPSPSVYLSAVAQRTKRLRFGPLVYLLPFYHPLRLVEEICMLDNLSGGRMEVGIGRGVSPLERGHYGIKLEETQAMYDEAYQILVQGLTGESVTFEGRHYSYKNVPLELRPVQRPFPAFWYGLHSPESAARCARQGYNIVTLDPTDIAREPATAYKAAWDESGRAGVMPKVGIARFVVVAETDDEALAVARRAFPVWHRHFSWLYHKHGMSPMSGERPPDFDPVHADGRGVAGSPETVTKALLDQLQGTAFNYLISQFAFGDMTAAESLRSIELFGTRVMPVLRAELGRPRSAQPA